MTQDLVPQPGAAAPSPGEADRERIELLKRHYADKASDRELELFANVSEKLGLSPQAKQIYAVSRWNSKDRRYDLSIQIGIDGLRLLAERSGQYAGSDAPLWCGPDGRWAEIWLDDAPPIAAKVTVWRQGSERPVVGVAMYKNFREDSALWRKMPEHMLAVAAERQALRKAFPADLAAWESSVREATISIEDRTDEAPAPIRPEPPKQLSAPAPPPPPAAHRAPVLGEASPEAEASRAPEHAPEDGDDAYYGAQYAEAAARETPTKSNSGPEPPPEKPEITAFYALCEGLGLDRAALKRLLGVPRPDDTAAVLAALDARYIPHTRKGLSELAAQVAALVQAPAAEPIPEDAALLEPAEALAH